MARIRTIKPEFWMHEDLSALPEATHLLAAALLNYADDYGYFNANPALIRATCSPLREPSVSIPESLRSLQEVGYIELGTCEKGRRYGRISNFLEHQRVSHPSKSKIEVISIAWGDNKDAPEYFRKPPESFRPEQGTGNREQGSGTGNREVEVEQGSADALSHRVLTVFEHWQRVMNHPKAILDDKRKKLIRASLKLGYSVEDLQNAITGYSLSPFHMGLNADNQRHDGLGLILRSAEKIDKGLALHKSPPRPMGKQGRAEAMNRQAVDEFVGGASPFGDDRGAVIDGEAYEVSEEVSHAGQR